MLDRHRGGNLAVFSAPACVRCLAGTTAAASCDRDAANPPRTGIGILGETRRWAAT
jgi:hypothetical protein